MWSDLYIRLRSLFFRKSVDQELDDELRFHLEQQTAKHQQAGLTAEQARRRARVEFGGLGQIKDECQEARGVNLLETIAQDLRYALRVLRQSPGFTVVVVLTLGLGIGANTAIFSIVNSVLLQSLPVRDPEQLVVLQWTGHQWPHEIGMSSFGDCAMPRDPKASTKTGCSLSYPMFEAARNRSDLFASTTAFAGPAQMNLSGNGPASMVRGKLVSGDYFQTLGVTAALGRTLQQDDDLPNATPVAILDYAYWQGAFGGANNVVGKTVRLNNLVFTIVGVANRSFTRLTPGQSVDLWVPLRQTTALGISWGRKFDSTSWWLTVVARLRPGVSRTRAQAGANVLFVNQTLYVAKPAWHKTDDPALTLLPASSGLVGVRSQLGKPLSLLMAAVAIVLLIACANVAGLMLARGTAREKELAVRLALGAGRGRIVRQLLTESLLLSFLGAALAAFLAYWGTQGLAAFFGQNNDLHLLVDLNASLPVLLFMVCVAVATGIGFGLMPAFHGARANVAAELKAGSRAATATGHAVSRRLGAGPGLVVLQVGLSVVVLTGAGLLIRTLDKLHSIDPGFDTRNILLFSLEPARAGYKDKDIHGYYETLQRRLATLPGVASVSYSSDALLDGGLWTEDVRVEGQADKNTVESQMLAVGPDFFSTMRIRLATGRILHDADMVPEARAALVNQAFVRRFLAGRSPLGLHFGATDPNEPQWQIVGIVGDTKYATLRKPDAPTAYVPLRNGGATFALRTRMAPALLTPAVRLAVNEVDRNVPVVRMRTQSETIDQLLFNERLLTHLFALFGGLGLVLACVGLYGLLSYEVARRTRELGIRNALGAQRRDILALVLRQGLALVICGVVTGLVAAFAITRLLEGLLFGVRPTDPLTFAMVVALLVAVGAAACLLPAQRALRVDPMVALRCE